VKPIRKKVAARKPRSDGGPQALCISPKGVSEKDSPVINALKPKEPRRV